MILGRVEHHLVFIESSSKEEMGALRKALKFYQKKFRPDPHEFPFIITDIFDKQRKAFPTGYLEKVKEKLSKKDIDFKFVDKRSYRKNTFRFKQKTPFENPPRSWQKKAVDNIEEHPVGFISAPTASGKSRVIFETILHHKVKTLVLVPTTNIQTATANKLKKLIGSTNVSTKLPKQTEEEYLAEQEKINQSKRDMMKDVLDGKEADGFFHTVDESSIKDYLGVEETAEEKYLKEKGHTDKKKVPSWKKKKFSKKKSSKSYPVTVVCYQGLDDYSKKFLETIECIIIDEGHHASAKTFRDALSNMPNAAFRYGFSATPWRDQKHEMELLKSSLGENIIFEYDPEKALEEEVIAAPDYKIIHPAAPEVYLAKHTNWRFLVENGIIGNKVRNDLIVKEAEEHFQAGKNILICVDEIAHAEILEEKFKDIDIDSILIHGRRKNQENDENIKKVGENKDQGMISIGTMAIGEGTDMPYIDVVILASGGKSTIKLLQRIGRGARRPDGKDSFLIIDFQDWFNPILLKHSLARQKTVKEYYNI